MKRLVVRLLYPIKIFWLKLKFKYFGLNVKETIDLAFYITRNVKISICETLEEMEK